MSLVLTIGKHVTGVYGAKGGKKCTRYQARENMHLVPRGGGGGGKRVPGARRGKTSIRCPLPTAEKSYVSLVTGLVLSPIGSKTMGAFHSTKNSGIKFRVFHVTNGTVFSGWFEPSRPSPSRTNFRAKIPNKQGNQKMADSLSILLALELLDDYEVEISEVLDEDNDITLFSVGSSYMCRN